MDDKQKRRRKRNKNLSSQEFQIPEKVKKTLPPTVNVELEVEYIMKNMFGAELGNILLPEQVIEEAENTKTEDETINEDNVYNLQHNMYKSLQDSSDEEDKSFFKYNTLHETTHNSPRNSEHENDSLDIKLTKPKRPINKPDDLGERIQKKVYHEDDEFERGGPVLPLNSDSEEYSPAVYVLQDINKDFSEQTPREKDRNNAPSNTEHANDSPDMNLTKSKRPINKPNDLGERIQKKVYHEDDEFKRGGSVLPLNSDSEEYSNEDDEFERGGPVLPLNMYKSLQDSSDEEDKSFFKYNTLHETTHNSPRNIEHENDSLDIKLTKPKRPINKPDDLGERIQKKVYHEDDEFKKGGPVQPLNSDSEEYSPAVYVLQDINEDFSEQTTQEKDRNNAPSNTEHDNDSLDMNLTKPKRPINRPDDLGERIQKKVYHEDDEFERGGPVLPLNSDSEEYIPAVYGLQDINEDFSEQTTQEKDRNTEAKYRKDDHIPAFSDNNDPSDSSEEHCEIECPSKFSIKISKQTWETIKPKEKQYALSGKWTDVLSKEFYKINSSCVLAFKYNRVKKMGSRKKTTPYFKGKAYCGHAKGTMYEFTIRKKPKDSKEFIKIKVQTHGNCVHKEQVVKKRKLTGKQRTEIGKRLETEGASNVHYTLMADMPNEAIEHGNFTECLTKKVLQEVLYEIRQKEKFAKEDIADVLLTKNAMSDLDETSKKIKGYIQSVGADPFSIICYTEEQIRLMKRLKKKWNFGNIFRCYWESC
ncbi:reticulocyte-binding protein homolog 1-like [Mytilus edulis]|uniref:reticulocyte-binding protein homolog 1-like n=1 Tax=Mytilus edulis TaxID=6550 RepID=UPI0039F13971